MCFEGCSETKRYCDNVREWGRGGEKGKEEGDGSKKSKAHAEEYKANKQCAHELETNWNHSERHTELLPIAISNCP